MFPGPRHPGSLKIEAPDHSKLVNKLFARLREKDADAKFIFCATYYGGTGTNPPRIEFQKMIDARNYYGARNMFRHLDDPARRLEQEFPSRCPASKRTIETDIQWMKKTLP